MDRKGEDRMSARGIVVPMVVLAAFAAGCTGGEQEAAQEPEAGTTGSGRTTAPAPTDGGTKMEQETTSDEATRTAGGSGTTGLGGSSTSDGSSGNVASEPRDVRGFDEVELSGVGNLSIRQTGTESLSVRAEEDVLRKIRTEVVDGRLLIGPEPNTSIETTEPIDYELTVDDLGALELSGSGEVGAEGIDTDELVVDISGSGTMKTSGRAESQEAHVSGSGSYDAQDLESRRVRIDVEGAGSAVVNASEELDAKVGGTGSVEYVGDPTVRQDVSGVGRVSKR